jgi:ribosomal protein S18 acetylase RimI-like enzyme
MSRIAEEQIYIRLNGRKDHAAMVRMAAGGCQEILTLQQEVAAQIEPRGSYFALSEAEVLEILNGSGLAVGVRVDGRLIAFCFALFPGFRSDNLGRDFGMTAAELEQVAHLEAAVVHPDYRGNAFAKKMAGFLVAEIREAKRWRYVMNTVSPFNIPSLKTTLALGLLIQKLKVKYNDVLRYIFCLDLKKPVSIDMQSVIRVSANDLPRQQKLLANGYYGFRLENQAGDTIILYGKDALR